MLANRTTINDQLNRTFCLKNTRKIYIPEKYIYIYVYIVRTAIMVYHIIVLDLRYFT